MIDLTPGRPDTGRLATPQWRAAWRDAAAAAGTGAPPPQGSEPLREQIAEHLRLMRGVVRDPEDLFVTAGARDGLQLLLAVLGGHAGRGLRVAVEDPGYPSLRRVPERLGHEVLPVPIDDQGLDPARLPSGAWAGPGEWEIERPPDAVIVTPSHQYPLGASMPAARRLELLGWARAHDALIVEDDYDSELRYTSEPLPALAALDTHGRVITLGTFATTLAPGVGVGFLLAPPGLVPALAATRADLGQPVSVVTQRALAAYLASGELRRHTHRMRALYRRRRAEVAAAFGARGVRVSPMDGGLHCVVETTRPEADVVADAAAHGVLVAGLSTYWTGGPAHDGVVFGFGAVDEDALRRGLDVLAEACAGGAHGPRRSSG